MHTPVQRNFGPGSSPVCAMTQSFTSQSLVHKDLWTRYRRERIVWEGCAGAAQIERVGYYHDVRRRVVHTANQDHRGVAADLANELDGVVELLLLVRERALGTQIEEDADVGLAKEVAPPFNELGQGCPAGLDLQQ